MAGQKKHPIGTGESGHSGHGRSQSGSGNWGGGVAVKGATEQIASDGIGHGKGYQTSAHTDTHHHNGEAVGHPKDHGVFDYRTTLHSEKSGMNPVPDHGKAAHHPSMSGEHHKFPNNKSGSGFGHAVSNMKGP